MAVVLQYTTSFFRPSSSLFSAAFMCILSIIFEIMIFSSNSYFTVAQSSSSKFYLSNRNLFPSRPRGFRRSRIIMMPEGPEVRATVDNIKSSLTVHTDYNKDQNGEVLFKPSNAWYLSRITILSGRYHDKDIPNFHELNKILPIALNSVNCKGKFIFFSLDKSYSLWSTLGLSGGWTVSPLNVKPSFLSNHVRLCLTFNYNLDDDHIMMGKNQTKEISLFFYDQRNFGTFKIGTDVQELEAKLKSLGHCWLSCPPTLQQFRSILAEKRTQTKPLAVLLMNQKKTAGVGNYLLSEILYSCRIYPWATCVQLSEEDVTELYFVTLSTVVKSYLSQTDSATKEYYYQRFCDGWIQSAFHDSTSANEATVAGGSLWAGKEELLEYIRKPFRFTVYMQSSCPRGYQISRAEGPHQRTVHWVKELQTKHAPPSSNPDHPNS